METFENLELSKRQRILDAAYKEFAEHGYEHASTNRIVKEAGIGKGMLFYYFKSKKELYHYLINYGIDYVFNEFLCLIDEKETDFIKKYKQAAQIKMNAYTRNPHVFEFFADFYISKDELNEELMSKLISLKTQGIAKIFEHVDTSLFREDIPPESVIKLIQWTLDGYEKELVAGLKGKKVSAINMEPYWKNFYEFLDILRKVYYK